LAAYEPRGGFDRSHFMERAGSGYDRDAGDRYAADRYDPYLDRDLLPPPPPPRVALGGPSGLGVAEAAAAGAASGGQVKHDESDEELDLERQEFEAELARVAAEIERVSDFVMSPCKAQHCREGSAVVCFSNAVRR
jgi:hypothetical protein